LDKKKPPGILMNEICAGKGFGKYKNTLGIIQT
jgi:hypothetical protein